MPSGNDHAKEMKGKKNSRDGLLGRTLGPGILVLLVSMISARRLPAEDWLQYKFDPGHSGNAPGRSVDPNSLGLIAAVALTDGIYTSPVLSDGKIFIVDGAGVAFCIEADSGNIIWKTVTKGGAGNVNNVSSPALVGKYLHFGTTSGFYCVLDRDTGRIVGEIDCRDPIFSTPVVNAEGSRAYFVTLGSQVFAVEPNGTAVWKWDFVKEIIGFPGNRWSGEEWYAYKKGRVNWRDHFVCSRNMAVSGKTLVIPAGGRIVYLEDEGDQPRLRIVGEIPSYHGKEYPAAFGLSIGQEGETYLQWHRRDNAGRTEILRLTDDDKLETSVVPGTETYIDVPGLLSFSSVSIRGKDVYRTRPERGFGLCRHRPQQDAPESLGAYPSIAPPVLLKDQIVCGGLDGVLYVLPISGAGETWKFVTPLGRALSAPVAVADGKIVFGGEDGYIYILGPHGEARVPRKDLGINRIRSPLTGELRDSKYDWYTNYGNMGCTNANDQGITPPLKMRWVRRSEGTVKHIPVCGGGRMYTHTAEGQIIAVEQETGRLLWRRYRPGVYLSFTSPLFYREKLIVPQTGLDGSVMVCLDAASGKLLWEAPFTGTASWSRQFPPVIHGNLAIYASGSGKLAPGGSEKAFGWRDLRKQPDGKEVMGFIYSHNNPYYPADSHPRIWAWDLDTGNVVWEKDFREYGAGGNDCGIAMMDGKLFYSTYFGYQADKRKRRGLKNAVNGLTAKIDPSSGKVEWLTTDYFVTAGCAVTAKDGRIYLGGYNQAHEGTKDRFIYCLDGRNGELVWKSDPVASAVNVVSVGEKFIFSNAIRAQCHVFDKKTGKIAYQFDLDYACTRFTLSGDFLMGSNMDMLDLSSGHRLVATGPAVDSRECLGSAVSNGRIFYLSQASGLAMSAVSGKDAVRLNPVWETR